MLFNTLTSSFAVSINKFLSSSSPEKNLSSNGSSPSSIANWTLEIVSSATSSLKEDDDFPSIVLIILCKLGNILFISSETVIFCGLVAVNSWPIASATFGGRRRNLCVAFKGAAGELVV